MRLEVLGTNSAFAPTGVNNSFILWKNEENGILLDCGFGVFAELMRKDYAKNIHTLLLSHLHQDHCGSAVNFLDYRFKILKQKTALGGTPTDEFLRLHSGDDWQEKISDLHDIALKTFAVPHAKGMECCALFVENRLLYSGDSAISLLDREEAFDAEMIIHDVSLAANGAIVDIEALGNAAPEIRTKTFVSHYHPKDYDTLAQKASSLGLGGVLKAGDFFDI